MTADELQGRVSIEIEGETRYLRYTQANVRRLMDALDVKILPDLAKRLQHIDAEMVGAAVWAGLQTRDGGPSQEEVSEWFIPLAPAIIACQRALNLALFGHPEGGSDDTQDPPRSNGKSRRKAKSKRSGKPSASPPASA